MDDQRRQNSSQKGDQIEISNMNCTMMTSLLCMLIRMAITRNLGSFKHEPNGPVHSYTGRGSGCAKEMLAVALISSITSQGVS